MKAEVRELGTREVVRDFPNFRDHGMTVEGVLLKVLSSLTKKHGEAWASEAGLRRMICEDTRCPECGVSHPVGHMPGTDTIPTALERLELEGVIAQEWLLPGGILPDGSDAKRGTRLIRLARNRREHFAFAERGRTRNRRQGVTRRVNYRALASLEQARAGLAKAVDSPKTAQIAHDLKRQEALKLAEQWMRENPDPTPD